MQKLFLSAALAASFLMIFAVAAFATPVSMPASATATVGIVDDMLRAHEAQARQRYDALKAEVQGKASRGDVVTKADFQALKCAAEDEARARKDAQRILSGRVAKLRKAENADRADIEALIKETRAVRGLSKVHAEQLINLTTQVAEIGEEQKAQGERMGGIEQRQNRTDSNVQAVHKEVGELAARGWQTDMQLGIFTGRGIASSETGIQFGYGSTNAFGNGWFTSLSLGAGDMFHNPHPTSVVVRFMGQTTLGGPASPLTFFGGLVAGSAARTSLSQDSGIAVGGTAGINIQPRGWAFGGKVWADQVFGRYEGFAAYAGVYFDPTAIANLGLGGK